MNTKYPDPISNPPNACLTDPGFLPTEGEISTDNAEPHFLLASYENEGETILGAVFLQRLTVPMSVHSERAGVEIELPDLASIHRWAATEFGEYEMGKL